MIGQLLYWLYRFHRRRLRALILWIVLKMEGGPLYSVTLRRIFKDYHQVEVGMYTHGSCFTPGNFDRFTTVGRYCSIAADVRTFNRDHPLDFKSTHAFFFNPALRRAPRIGRGTTRWNRHDVWIGYGVSFCGGAGVGDGGRDRAASVVQQNIRVLNCGGTSIGSFAIAFLPR